MQNLLRKALITGLGLNLIMLPASAVNIKSLTKNAAGISYKLTTPNPLPMGEQKLTLKLSRGTQGVKGAKLTAVASMGDGMKAAVKITPKANGELELKTKFTMGGEWELKLQQTEPVKTEVKFDLTVSGGSHSGHHM